VAAVIEGEIGRGREAQRAPGQSLAVLLRHPGASVDLESALESQGFHVETHGFEPFLQRPEVQFLRTLVAWVTQSIGTLARSDLVAIQDAFAEFTGCRAHETTRGVRHTSLAAFKDYFLGDPEAFARGIRNDAVISWADEDSRAALRRFVEMFAAGITPRDLHRRLQDLGFVHLFTNAFVHEEQVADAMAAMTGFAKTAGAFDSFAGWLEGMAQREWAARSARGGARRSVHLYSIPAAKGLEFDRVVMPDIDAASFDGSAPEERNLFYVGVSRARLRLALTFRDRPSSYLGTFGRAADWDEVVGSEGLEA
jgi:DNA helicase-2/ATP-dependent DNA helicase PcrA